MSRGTKDVKFLVSETRSGEPSPRDEHSESSEGGWFGLEDERPRVQRFNDPNDFKRAVMEKLQQYQLEAAKSKNTMKLMVQNAEKMKATCLKYQTQAKLLIAELEEVEGQRDLAQHKLGRAQARVRELEAESDKFAAQEKRKIEKSDKSTTALAELRAENDRLRRMAEVERSNELLLQNDNNELKAEIKKLEWELSVSKDMNEKLQSTQNSRVEEVEAEHRATMKNLVVAQGNNQKAQLATSNLQRELEETQKQLRFTSSQQLALSQELEACSKRCREAESQLADAQRNQGAASETQEKLETLTRDLQSSQCTTAELRERENALSSQLKEVSQRLEHATQKHEEAISECDRLRGDCDRLREECDRLRGDCDRLREERDALAAAPKQTVFDVAALDKEIQTVIAQLLLAEDALESQLTCMSCLQLYSCAVAYVPCGHSVCTACMEDMKRKNGGHCCCKECGVSSNVSEHLPLSLLDSLAGKVQHRKQILTQLREASQHFK